MKRYNVTFLAMIFTSLFLLASSVYIGNGFAQEERSAEVDKYIDMLKSQSIPQRIEAAKRITGSGLTDPKLFNVIKEELLKRLESSTSNDQVIDEMSWFCKALASSGLEEYKETLKKVADHTENKKLKRYALQSLDLVDEYAKKNKIMSETKYAEAGLSPEVVRYINMLKSDDISLKKDAAKRITRSGLREEKLFEVVNEELLKMSPNSTDNNYVDTTAWLCKALAASGMPKYKETLKKITETTSNGNLKKHCQKSLEMLEASK